MSVRPNLSDKYDVSAKTQEIRKLVKDSRYYSLKLAKSCLFAAIGILNDVSVFVSTYSSYFSAEEKNLLNKYISDTKVALNQNKLGYARNLINNAQNLCMSLPPYMPKIS